ncbi:MAG: hypothetical protein IH865_04350 [Chloroflexi bacterium]|nr:hypothetical protein [Chloroflexota bacterium]
MEDTTSRRCTHRWVLGEPTMSTVSGVCRHCGARRTYPSVLGLHQSTPDYAELDRKAVVRSLEAIALGEAA